MRNTRILPSSVVADKGYDSETFADYIYERKGEVDIPSHRTAINLRNIDKNLYKDRNKVERFFGRMQHYRRIATRYDKTTVSYLYLYISLPV